MDHIYDILDDSQGLILTVIDKETPLPPFAKTANMEYGDPARDNVKTWAWERMRRYALDTPAQVLQSHRYFQKTARHIPADEVSWVRANIDRVAKFMGVPLEVKTKQASLEYEVPLEDFAVKIPVDKLSDHMRSKYANYLYADHLVLYPLGTDMQIKTANLMFPKGLDEELEYFRPFIAQDIAKKLSAESLAPKVKEYQPIPKSAAIEQLELRQEQFKTDPPNMYKALIKMVESPDFNRRKFASLLEEIDQRSGADMLYTNTNAFYRGNRYLAGIHDDTPENPFITLKGREIPLAVFQKSASTLKDMYPTIERVLDKPDNFQKFLGSVTEGDRSYILNAVIGIHKG